MAAARIKREGLEGRCLVEYRALRDLPAGARYDKIAAIGVIEHVGVPNYPASSRASRDGSTTAASISITASTTSSTGSRPATPFPLRAGLPNGDLSGVSETMTEMERANWEVLDVENCASTTPAPAGIGWRASRPAATRPGRSSGERTYRPGSSTSRARRWPSRAARSGSTSSCCGSSGTGWLCRAHDSRRPLRLRRPPSAFARPSAFGWDNREKRRNISAGSAQMNRFARRLVIVAVCLLAVLALETPAGACGTG